MENTFAPRLDKATRDRIGIALGRIPQGQYILTSAYEGRERAVLVSWVQQASFDPPMVVVALDKTHDIMPLIHESHAFALSQVAAGDRLTVKKFASHSTRGSGGAGGNGGRAMTTGDDEDHPLQAMSTIRRLTGSPILAKAMCFMDCELVRHVDVEGDHDLYVGAVRDAAVLHEGEVHVHLREDGFKY